MTEFNKDLAEKIVDYIAKSPVGYRVPTYPNTKGTSIMSALNAQSDSTSKRFFIARNSDPQHALRRHGRPDVTIEEIGVLDKYDGLFYPTSTFDKAVELRDQMIGGRVDAFGQFARTPFDIEILNIERKS